MPETCQASNPTPVCDVEVHSGMCICLIHINALHVFHCETQEVRGSLNTHAMKSTMVDVVVVFIVIIQNIPDHVSNVTLSGHLVGNSGSVE